MSDKRVTIKLKHPNPLFEKWLAEWRDEAKAKDSKMQYCYTKALESLKKYPLPLQTGRDCKILNGFGDRLCQMLDEKLSKHNSSQDEPDPDKTIDYVLENIGVPKEKQKSKADTPKKKVPISPRRNQKEYIPAHRSGAYAILITLYENCIGNCTSMTKKEIVEKAQDMCNKSFTKPDLGSRYTSWSSMKTLLEKELVAKRGNPANFSLTTSGKDLSMKLYENSASEMLEKESTKSQVNESKVTESIELENEVFCIDDKVNEEVKSSQSSSKSEKKLANFEMALFAPYTFEVLLVVDKQETAGSKEKLQNDPVLLELTNLDVPHDVKHLKVGDYVWICRSKTTPNVELVLPYVVERKRMDDFGSSIKDGRYHEQKFRLKQCGIQNIVYLIESYGDNTHTGLPLTTLYQAATNTLIQDGFTVKFCENLKGTARYLDCMTKILKENYESKTVMSCPKVNLEKSTIDDDLVPLMNFQEFNQSGAKYKNFTASEMFIKHLVQLKGVSIDKAMAIVEKYPTVKLLKEACDRDVEETEKTIANIQFGKKKRIGPAISSTLCRFYTSTDFP
ncbi:mus81 [Trypoxylus dichotomus]